MPLSCEELNDVSELLLEHRRLSLQLREEKRRPSPDGEAIHRLTLAQRGIRGHVARLLDAG